MLDARCSMLDARCSMLDARCSMLDARCDKIVDLIGSLSSAFSIILDRRKLKGYSGGRGIECRETCIEYGADGPSIV
jgi:hypothetical protein